MRKAKEVTNTSIPMNPMTIPITGFVMDSGDQTQPPLMLFSCQTATLPPLNETTVATFLKNKVKFRMFQIILTLGVH